jgi:hypothetical protein
MVWGVLISPVRFPDTLWSWSVSTRSLSDIGRNDLIRFFTLTPADVTFVEQFAPNVLAAIDFQGGPGTGGLMAAVAVLNKPNVGGGRKVPENAPTLSRRYADPSTYLYTPEQWQPRQAAFCALVEKPASAAGAVAQGKEEPHTVPAEQEKTLAGAAPDDTCVVDHHHSLVGGRRDGGVHCCARGVDRGGARGR